MYNRILKSNIYICFWIMMTVKLIKHYYYNFCQKILKIYLLSDLGRCSITELIEQ